MKRMKRLATCGLAVVCAAALLAVLAGCSSKEGYVPPEKEPTLSSPTIGKDGTLRVGVNADSAPLAGQPNSSSKIIGIDVDIAAALADSFGLKLEIVDVGADPAAALTEERVDIVLGIDKSDTEATFWKSEAYLPTGVALFAATADAAVPTNATAPAIAAQVSSKSAWAVTNEFDQGAITTTDDLKGAFAALESGQVQYVAADAVIGAYAAHNAGDEVHVVALMQQPSGYCAGVLDSKADLKQAVSDALATLTGNGIISVIETKWLGIALDLSTVPLTEGATANKAAATAEPPATPAAEGDAAAEGEGKTPAESELEAGGNAVQPEDVAV
ncbi:substrate-binding periplasmic protein [Arabiibacter massiliensis]|uniref:substrate-binding periplasmic protein n=1 Tax=Arabiibacter massiliensis TaxID=1870985 RepID=UPI0009BBEE7D|nr:transporter substrate-binding domain-containing protein [Arabiibacter massiliensis]